jgi:NADH dehydrogenase
VLDGADALVNTYWIRLPHGKITFETAIDNTRLLFDVAGDVGVGRFVQTSVSNAPDHPRLAYYAGKAALDRELAASNLSHAIVRPTLIVGPRDVLTNNIAWILRRFPCFGMPRGGAFGVQPVTLDDTGRIMADAAESTDDMTVDAAGPDIFTFRDYVDLVQRAIGTHTRYVTLPDWMMMAMVRTANLALRDQLLSYEELLGLHEEALVSNAPPLGTQSVEPLLRAQADTLGRAYVNDTRRHFTTQRHHPV